MVGGRLRRRWRRLLVLLQRIWHQPGYAVGVLATLCRHPGLLLMALRRGWRGALLQHCLRCLPGSAGLFSAYEAGFFGQVWLFDEYEVGRLPLGPAPVVVDVGANVGFFSWRVAASHPGAQLLALEPSSENHRRLQRVFALAGLSGEACRLACGQAAGQATLFLRNSVTHSLDPGWHTDLDAGAGSEEVSVATLDAACDSRGIADIDLLKIDVEGAEVDVLTGATAMLPRTRFVVLEYHSRERRAACLAILAAAGFACRDKSFWGAAAGNEGEGLLLCTRVRPAAGVQSQAG